MAMLKPSAAALLALAITGCGGSGSDSAVGTGNSPSDREDAAAFATRQAAFNDASRVFTAASEAQKNCRQQSSIRVTAGGNYHVTITSASGETISFQVIEPKTIDCVQGNPLVLHGHGFGGERVQNPAGTDLERLQDNGYAVISIDQRGFNDSSGTVRVMDPDFEGQDLLAILDWAEANLDYLAYEKRQGSMNVVAGSTGGSYGGMYQLLIHNIDPKHRLDALTPDITPHDLRYSLNPGGAVKSTWATLLVVGGEAGANQPLIAGLDLAVKETLLNGILANEIKTPALNFFYYHSVRYFADPDGTDISDMDFLTAMDAIVPIYASAPKPKPVDILFTQGMRDTLFNFNEGLANYTAYKALGGDVRLMTHQSGHILPGLGTVLGQLSVLGDGVSALLGQLSSLGASLPDLQKPAGRASCGALDLWDAQVAFLNEKLLPPNRIPTSSTTQQAMDQLKTKVCMSLDDADGTQPGNSRWLAADRLLPNPMQRVAIPSTPLPVPNALLGVTSLIQPTFIPLTPGPLTIAGLAEISATVSPLVPADGCSIQLPDTGDVPAELSPFVNSLPTRLPISACDSIVYVGLGKRRGMAAPELIDEQITPLRGLGRFEVPLVGVAEQLAAGEELGLMVYGYNLQYVLNPSRDLLLPAVTISGNIGLPLQP